MKIKKYDEIISLIFVARMLFPIISEYLSLPLETQFKL